LPAYLAEMENAHLAQAQLQNNALRLSTDAALKKSAKLKSVDPDFDESEGVSIRKLFATGIELFATYSPFT
jgi:ABC-type tungstate transport system permease subunit